MKFLFSLITILALFGIIQGAQQQNIGIESKNPNFNYERSCRWYTDCHNCTVSRCRWDSSGSSGKCKGYESYDAFQLHYLQIDDFFTHSAKCNDNKRFCERVDNEETEQTRLSFIDKFTYMPLNYFCTYDIQKDDGGIQNDKSDFAITTGRTLYTSDKIELDRVFAQWTNGCHDVANQDNNMCNEKGYMKNDDVNHHEVFNLTDIKDLKIGFINIFALTKGINSALPDHFEVILTYFPKPFLQRVENAADRAVHRKSAWVLLLMIIIIIGCIVGGVYYFEMRKGNQNTYHFNQYQNGWQFGSRVDPYSDSVVEEKQGLINPDLDKDDAIESLQPERNPQSAIDLLSSPKTVARANNAQQNNGNSLYQVDVPTPNGPTPGEGGLM